MYSFNKGLFSTLFNSDIDSLIIRTISKTPASALENKKGNKNRA